MFACVSCFADINPPTIRLKFQHFSVWMDSQPATHIISSETNRFVPCHTLHTSHRLNFYMKHVAIIIQTISLYRDVAWVEFLIEILNAYV